MNKNIVFMTCLDKAPDVLDYKEFEKNISPLNVPINIDFLPTLILWTFLLGSFIYPDIWDPKIVWKTPLRRKILGLKA